MDDRQGNIYESRHAALAAGVPDEHIQEVEPEFGLLRVLSGPFKGRLYRRTATGLVRVTEHGEVRPDPAREDDDGV